MEKVDLKPGQLIECEWNDPCVSSTWQPVGEVTTFFEFLCQSVGYVHLATAKGLVLTACYGTHSDGGKSLLLRQYLPWESITDLWILETREV